MTGPDFDQNYYRNGLPSVPGDTSEGAADSFQPGTIAGLRRLVFLQVQGAEDGITCDEVEVKLGMIHQTASARIRELVLGHFIEDSGARRPTRHGRGARVYRELESKAPDEPEGGWNA